MKQLRRKELKKLKKETNLKRSQEIALVLDNVQYARNIASMFRTADAAGIKSIYITGISEKPPFGKELQKASRKKEKNIEWEYNENTAKVINKLKKDGYYVCAIEFTDESIPVRKLPVLLQGKAKIAFVTGNEVYGVPNRVLEKCDTSIHIPMYGIGASINVSHALAVILFSF